MDHLPEPAVELWQKVLPLGMIFFCASFNLTILQVCVRCEIVRLNGTVQESEAAAAPAAAVPASTSPSCRCALQLHVG
jgi:hypothetical protein